MSVSIVIVASRIGVHGGRQLAYVVLVLVVHVQHQHKYSQTQHTYIYAMMMMIMLFISNNDVTFTTLFLSKENNLGGFHTTWGGLWLNVFMHI